MSPGKGVSCDFSKHDDCDWDEMIQDGIESKFRELKVSKPKTKGSVVNFKVSFTNRSDVIAADVESKIDKFLELQKSLTVKSLIVQ